jgi:hypothetical protein
MSPAGQTDGDGRRWTETGEMDGDGGDGDEEQDTTKEQQYQQ